MDTLTTVKKRYKLASTNQKEKFEKFNDFDYIFHSKLKYYDPGIPSRVFNPIVWSFIETIVTRMLAKNPIIAYKPRENGDQVKSQILTQLFDYWFSKGETYPKIVSWVKDALTYGTGIIKVDWFTSSPRMVKSYALDPSGQPAIGEDGQFVINESPVVDFDDPRLRNVNIYDFFVDPKATSIENAKWVIHQYWADIDDLEEENETAKQYGKVIYNKAALKRLKDGTTKATDSYFEEERKRAAGNNNPQSDDKTLTRLKIWEMWENGRCVVIANEVETLRDETNYFWHGKKPFIRIVDSIVPNEFWGKGEIEPVEKLLHALNTTQNQRITNVNRILNPMWKATDQVDDDELQFTDNGIIHVTQMTDTEMVQITDITSKAYQEQESIIEQMQRALGVTDYTQGLQTPGQTASEVQIKTAQANERFAHKVKLFEEMGLQPLGDFVYKLYQQFTTKAKVMRVAGPQGEQYVTLSPADLVGEMDVIPESDSTLQTDQQEEFTKFLNLFQILQPYVAHTMADPVTGQPVSTGFINEMELIKELINRSGEKDPERYFQQDRQVLGGLPGQGAPATANPTGGIIPRPTGVPGVQPNGVDPRMAALLG